MILCLVAGAFSGVLPAPVAPALESASAHHTNIKLPVPAGEQWRVTQGYNTNPATGGSHYSCDPATLRDQPSQSVSCSQYWQYKYSLDIVAVSGTTAGRPVLSPVNGVIRWIDQAYGGMSINLGDGYAYAFFHATLAPGLAAGQTVTQGQYLGTVAPPGGGGNGGFPHLHVTLWQTTDGGNWSRIPVGFSGAHSIDGVSLPALDDAQRNQHQGTVITSTNVALASTEQPPAAPILASPPHGTTYRVNTHVATLGWQASTGATSYQVVINDGAIVSPWVTDTSWTTGALNAGQYAWQVRARSAAGEGPLSPKWVFWVDPAQPGPEPSPGATPGTLSVSLTATSGAPGVSTTASGAGMSAGETVDIYWDSTSGAKLATATANSAGNWTANLVIPDATGGAHQVVARGVSSNRVANTGFTVNSALIRLPYQGPPGTSIAITVKGFGPNESVALTFFHTGSNTFELGTTMTNASGTGNLTVPMPSATTGWHDYQGRGQTSGRVAWGALYVQPAVTLSTAQGAPGASVTATAQGFPGSQTIRLAWNQSGSSSGTTLCNGTTSATGSYTCTFTVPQAAAGAYPIVATSSNGTTASINFGIAGAAAITITPNSGQVGAQFQISVGGFQANETVRLTIDGSSTTWQQTTAAANGTALVKATIPYLTQGAHMLAARGVTSGRTASGTLTVNPGMEINPSGGAAGTSVTAYVRGMAAGQSIAVRFNSTSATTGTSVCTGTTSNQGAFTCTFTVPSIAGGATYPVRAVSGGSSAVANFAVTQAGVISGSSVIGIGTYQVTATQEGLVGGTTSRGHVIVPDDHFVALPACTPMNCPWLQGGTTSPTLGYITDCGSSCYVRVLNPVTGICRVEPIWDTGPWFTNDNWWEPTERRNLNNLPGTVNVLGQGYPGVDAARDGLDVGYGRSGSGIGISNVGYEVGNRAAIDIADGTWKEIGFADGAGPRTVIVTMLWQTGENVDAARQACLGTADLPNPGGEPRISISTTFGQTGNLVTVSGSGYGAGERVDIYWDSTTSGAPLQSAFANSSGVFSIVVTIPNAEPGKHLLVGRGATSGLKPSRSYTVLPVTRISISPANGAAGTGVTVTGQGYHPLEIVSVFWDSTGSTGSRLGSASADADGAFSATFPAPTGTPGNHLFVARGDSSGLQASRTYVLDEASVPSTPPRIAIDPVSGPAGASVEVTGSGYAANEQVQIFWDSTGSTGTLLTTVTADGAGAFATSITIPNSSEGKHLIVGRGLVSDAKPSRSFTLVVRASVALNTYTSPSGGELTVTGQGYGPGESVDIFWDSTGSTGTRLERVTADSTGTFSTTITVPNATDGRHLVVGLGATSGLKASRSMTVTSGTDSPPPAPRIGIDPVTGPPGTAITVTGTGYEATEVIDIFWDSTTSGPILGTVAADANGAFTTTITVPDASDGKHLVVGKGRTSGAKPSRSFTVGGPPSGSGGDEGPPRISIAPTEGRTATTVTVTGAGYQPGERVDIHWDSTSAGSLILGNATAAADGTFTTTVNIPHAIGGKHLIVGRGVGSGAKPSRSFFITPSVATGVTDVVPGDSINLTLRGFQAGDVVNIYWDVEEGDPLATVTANATGSAAATVTIPQGVSGPHRLVAATGATTGTTAPLNLTGGVDADASVSLAVTSASPGERITVELAGFWSSERLEIFWDDRTTPTSALNAGFNGAVSGEITVPTMPGGAHTITVKGVSSGKSVTTNLTLTPVVILTPPIGEGGARIVVDVRGWQPGQSVTVFFNRPAGGSGGTAVCTATGRDTGTATCSFNVPAGFAVGAEVPVTASGAAGSATASLTITNQPVGTFDLTDEPVEAPEASDEPAATPDDEAPAPVETQPADEEPATEPDAPEGSTDEIVEQPVEDATEDVVEQPVEDATEDVVEQPVEDATEDVVEPADEPAPEAIEETPVEEPAPEPAAPPAPRSVTAWALSDVTVYAAQPETAGLEPAANALGAGGQDGAIAYVTFSVEGVGGGTVTDARLVLTGAGDPGGWGAISVVPGLWIDEASATYATLPTVGLTAAYDAAWAPSRLPPVYAGETIWVDVTASVTGDGIVTFVISGDPAALATLLSRESGNGPRLELTVQD